MNERLPQPDDPKGWIDWTTAQQALASDPDSSAWVSANAGSGKTHVLTQRVIRLLLSGARPSSILCLTYTKAAASEMSNRVFARLAEWATLSHEDLRRRIGEIEGRPPDLTTLTAARRLFAKALETPGGLKIQTIHAFCEALLHQFPLEANVAGHFSVLDDRTASALLADARRSLLTATAAENDMALASAFSDVLGLADEWGLDKLLNEIVSSRQAIRRFRQHAASRGGTDSLLRRSLGVAADADEQSLAEAFWPLPGLSGPRLSAYIDLANTKGGVNAQAIAAQLSDAVVTRDAKARVGLILGAFLTSSGAPKADKTMVTAAMLKAAPDMIDAIGAARDHVLACRDRLRIYQMYRATTAALTLAERLDRDYEQLKKVRSQLDFEDLIARAAELLSKSDVGPWIHYKLDQGIDHILVDEAQDTSPIQWQVVRSLRDDFFSGRGARQSLRTFFAVGDEKQSIYSFQGARPERFAEEGRQTKSEVDAGGLSFSAVRLPLSFRSTAAVLTAVDQVFSLPDHARGLNPGGDEIIHMSSRIGHPGTVEVWEQVVPPVIETTDDWTAPFDATPESAPSAVLARRIAHRISAMIGNERIAEKNHERFIEAGDILVLVRKRDAFVTALTRELKRRDDVPVAGADRLRLSGHIAVQDLLALGRFVLLPADDLSLCAVLKSPLFNLSEDDIFHIAAERPAGTSAWQSIQLLAATGEQKWVTASDGLSAFQALGNRLPVHDFYAHVLGSMGGRRAFLSRLGSEASDILDEFLAFALAFETAGLPSLQAFVSGLELETPEVKREQDKARGEVRIMTVHASKGLEAPVVFLVDGGSAPFNSNHLAKFRMMKTGDEEELPIWLPSSEFANTLTDADSARNRDLAEQEYRRLLYVAMTRAADRLIVCGFRGQRLVSGTWHQMIATALAADEKGRGQPVRFTGPEGAWDGIQWTFDTGNRRFPFKQSENVAVMEEPLPAALFHPPAGSARLPRPLSPSGLGLAIDDEDDAETVSPLFGEKQNPSIALQKGRLVHRMLQVLPGLVANERPAAAERYAARAARFWPEAERLRLVSDVLSVLDQPSLAPLYSGEARAEVSIMGRIRVRGELRAVSGRIDRLAVTEDRVLVLDYKTNRSVPQTAGEAPFSHRAQLAIYREILAPLYPGREVECLLVYTQEGKVLRLTEADLSRTLAELNSL